MIGISIQVELVVGRGVNMEKDDLEVAKMCPECGSDIKLTIDNLEYACFGCGLVIEGIIENSLPYFGSLGDY